jgi:hypothetical protein
LDWKIALHLPVTEKAKGFIKKRTSQRIDATHIISHVNRIATADLLFGAVRCLVEEIEKKDPSYYERETPEYIRERYSQRFSSFGISRDKRGEKLSEIVEDGLLIKELLQKLPSDRLNSLEQLQIMETIFRENVAIKKKKSIRGSLSRPKRSIARSKPSSIHAM